MQGPDISHNGPALRVREGVFVGRHEGRDKAQFAPLHERFYDVALIYQIAAQGFIDLFIGLDRKVLFFRIGQIPRPGIQEFGVETVTLPGFPMTIGAVVVIKLPPRGHEFAVE